MNNKFTPLDCDEDIILIKTDSFKVSRLRELVIKGIREKKPLDFGNNITVNTYSFFSHFHAFKIYERDIAIDEIQFQIVQQCEILKIGSKGWQTGQIRIKMSISPTGKNPDNVYLEFCPDELEEPESPLDDIRKMIQAQ
jgi:hypothetical protein